MNDFFGETIFVGDTVAFSSFDGSQLGKGVVIKITPKQFRIRRCDGFYTGRELLRDHAYVVKYLGNIEQ